MEVIKVDSKFFNPKDTLDCGQVFRYKPFKDGYLVFSQDKCCYLYENNGITFIESENATYFKNYFDLNTDYQSIYDSVSSFGNEFLSQALEYGKGIRILKQDKIETAFSFIISQNNNIVRIKNIIEKLCESLGKKYSFMGETCYAFPTVNDMANKDKEFYHSLGLGYRDAYVLEFAKSLNSGFDLEILSSLSTPLLEKKLTDIYGIGKKVADCILLFAYERTDCFPVDTWIEKLYHENFSGKEKDRAKISNELVNKFGNISGYVQQYVFHYKRINKL
ncbi:MAG: hypothetical protein J6Q58_02775 [Clostridia bacterium]|nr:hypothetical protein [Clostridia bacterium]